MMCTQPIRYLLSLVLGLGLSGYTVGVNAADAAVCKVVPVTVVNSSNQDVTLVGSNGFSIIKANSTSQIAFQAKVFYTHCGLMEVGFNGQPLKRGLIDEHASQVDIHVTPMGEFEQVGLGKAGLDLDQYVSWWGLRAVIG